MEPSDVELLKMYRGGDLSGLEKLIDRHRKPLFGYIWNMCNSQHESEEVFQEVWLRVIRNAGSYREKSFRAWLSRIAHNLVVDRWRSRKATVSLDMDDGEGRGVKDAMADKRMNPAGVAADAELGRRIAEAISSLPSEQREVVIMRTKGGLSFKEIARAQGVSINTALARMQYGLSKLRPLLKGEFESLNGGVA